MKTKLVMALLMVFFVTPMSEAAQYAKRKSTRFNFASCNDKLVTRVPKVELPVLNKARAFGGAFSIGR